MDGDTEVLNYYFQLRWQLQGEGVIASVPANVAQKAICWLAADSKTQNVTCDVILLIKLRIPKNTDFHGAENEL